MNTLSCFSWRFGWSWFSLLCQETLLLDVLGVLGGMGYREGSIIFRVLSRVLVGLAVGEGRKMGSMREAEAEGVVEKDGNEVKMDAAGAPYQSSRQESFQVIGARYFYG
ncbi:hypothetical protein BJ165DRAFT_1519180 [Panaeolus papilionaceus]|nr:hypothetical protein BJ165DRAFT_1519180 [Panaeolus papilionaceus]